MKKRIAGIVLALALSASTLAGCGGTGGTSQTSAETAAAETAAKTEGAGGEKTFVFGDTTFNAENDESTINPHEGYSGWACIRYGVGETLFQLDDDMNLQPWIGESYENVDDTTWKLKIKDGVTFSNGNPCDGEAVKACLEDLVKTHERAAGDLKIASIDVNGNELTIKTSEPNPVLFNYLAEPYGCIIDVSAGVTPEGMVIGTGPYVAKELVTDDHLILEKNPNYWNGDVNVDKITVRTISDGDTLALALQSGEIDAAYGMAYKSYPLFTNDNYTFSSTATSRSFYCQFNFNSPVCSDGAVRKAMAMGIDKEGFVKTLLQGYGYVGKGAFPDTLSYGGQNVNTESYDPEGAKKVLEDAGWVDSDGDGIREKDGQKLSVRWLTYPSRQELPLLAQSAQATLKDIGIDIQINSTADHNTICKDQSQWDVYVGANVNAGLGDPANFFSTHCLDSSTKNRGSYHNDNLEKLAKELEDTFNKDERGKLAIEMQQQILDDHAFIFCSFLKMSMISRKGVTGITAHPCDFYELTADLDVN